ncbi:MAG: hypothetical protein ABH854_05145 [Candidatus Diapherotrites archaeon]|nr:hypothetical protein [Candidatus Micrarchaeota archaeon]MBU1939552.1 hypothetical protein [Candidatus Micrarchaeota archaeon]
MPLEENEKSGKILLLDSSAILNDFEFEFSPDTRYIMTPECLAEIRDLRSRGLIENAFSQELLSVKAPSAQALTEARGKAEELGVRFSAADQSLVALAIDFRSAGGDFKAVTDDYSLQNVLKALDLPFSGIIHGEITDVRDFSKRAKNSPKYGKKYP